MKLFKKIGAALAISAFMLPGIASAEFLDFTVDEGSVAGAIDNVFTADKMNGGYTEILTINPDFSFDTVAFATFNAYYADEGSDLLQTQINDFGDNGYVVYAVFTSSGNFNPDGSFTGDSAVFNLYMDLNQDTDMTYGATATDPYLLTGAGEDYLLGTATNATSLEGIPSVPGAFDFLWNDFTLTAAGSDYFIEPDPFHMFLQSNGDFDQIIPAGSVGTFNITGDVSAVFVVPEPTSLALLGLGLLGFGVSRRRTK